MSTTISGDQSFPLVAGTFRNPIAAADAARRLQDRLPTAEVRLVQPGAPVLPQTLEPDDDGFFRTLVRSQVWLGLVGGVLGLTGAGALIAAGWQAAVSSPGFIVLIAGAGGAVAGLLVAGLVTLRPDRSAVIRQVRNRIRHGSWAVVARPGDRASADSALALLQAAGGQVLRSL